MAGPYPCRGIDQASYVPLSTLTRSNTDDRRYPGRTFLWDLSSLATPVNFNSYDGPTRARDLHMEIRGNRFYLANGKAGLRIVDLRRLGCGPIREIGSFDMEPIDDATDWFGAVQVDVLPSGIVLVGSVRQGLYVLLPRV